MHCRRGSPPAPPSLDPRFQNGVAGRWKPGTPQIPECNAMGEHGRDGAAGAAEARVRPRARVDTPFLSASWQVALPFALLPLPPCARGRSDATGRRGLPRSPGAGPLRLASRIRAPRRNGAVALPRPRPADSLVCASRDARVGGLVGLWARERWSRAVGGVGVSWRVDVTARHHQGFCSSRTRVAPPRSTSS
jgi:hypothetical protein